MVFTDEYNLHEGEDLIYVLCLSLPNRAITVQKALLLQSHVLKELTVHAQLSVTSLSAPLVAEASIAAAWVSQSPLEAARRAITVKKEPSQEYDNTYFDVFSERLLLVDF